MAAFGQGQITAAMEFADATIAALETEKGIHAETAVASAARMAGTFLFRSLGLKLKGIHPGQHVFSEGANEKGPQLVEVLVGVLQYMGIPLDAERLRTEPGPEHRPLLPFLETQRKVEPPCERIRQRLGLSFEEAAFAAAAASALAIRRTATVLDPHLAFHIAAYGFVEGAKTAPAPVG
jgi:hypothetical protein